VRAYGAAVGYVLSDMKHKWTMLPALLAAALLAGSGVAAATTATPNLGQTDQYLSLGDSLSVGFEPGPDGQGRPTANGFDHDLLPALQLADLLRGHALALTELGCPNETTTSMIDGGVCQYPAAKSQLDAAVQFLAAHRGHVRLVTLTIGATDLENCVVGTAVDLGCVQTGLTAVQTNLTTIVTALKQADPEVTTRFIGLNEYDPFVAAFLQGPAGQQLAAQSVQLVDLLNQTLASIYTPAGFRVADVASAFHTDDSTNLVPLPGVGMVPRNVASVCQLTFECSPPPVGPNIHPNDAGYGVMARAVAARL
jgi:lysophospholipase L1-like esterase